jgi:hypothetical protein
MQAPIHSRRKLFNTTEAHMSTESTLTHHLRAFGEGIESIMSDFTEESVVFTPDGQLHGLEQIRALFDGFLHGPPELLKAMTVTRQDVQGDVAYLLWKAEPFIPFAADTFLIRNDKILVQTIAIAPAATAATTGANAVGVEAL